MMPTNLPESTYMRVLGHELRRLRKQRGWTRPEFAERLQGDISYQALGSYELAARKLSVIRFVEICLALGEQPHELLARVHNQIFREPDTRMRIDLRVVVASTDPRLLPLRRWAEYKLAADGRQVYAHISVDAIEPMAKLCGLDTADLTFVLIKMARPAQGGP